MLGANFFLKFHPHSALYALISAFNSTLGLNNKRFTLGAKSPITGSSCWAPMFFVFADWFLFHDQPLFGRHSNAIFRNEEAGDGENAFGTCTISK